jgi:hypothetical protein
MVCDAGSNSLLYLNLTLDGLRGEQRMLKEKVKKKRCGSDEKLPWMMMVWEGTGGVGKDGAATSLSATRAIYRPFWQAARVTETVFSCVF